MLGDERFERHGRPAADLGHRKFGRDEIRVSPFPLMVRRSTSLPIFDDLAWHSAELRCVMRNQGESVRQSDGGDHQVIRADHLTRSGQVRPQFASVLSKDDPRMHSYRACGSRPWITVFASWLFYSMQRCPTPTQIANLEKHLRHLDRGAAWRFT
jgi:hypothetical protein